MSALYTGTHGLDWLVVAGQTLNCSASQIWSFGECESCGVGLIPSANQRDCVKCVNPHMVPAVDGQCAARPAGFEVDEMQAHCRSCEGGKVSSIDSECDRCPVHM